MLMCNEKSKGFYAALSQSFDTMRSMIYADSSACARDLSDGEAEAALRSNGSQWTLYLL